MMYNSFIDKISSIDRAIARYSLRLRNDRLTLPLIIVTYSGSGGVWFSLTAVIVLLVRLDVRLFDGQDILLAAMLGSFFSLMTGQFIKRVFKRRRPGLVIDGYDTLIRSPKDGSLPSTHTSTAIALFVGLTMTSHFLAPFIGVWSLLVSFSRYYLGVHYATDVLAGALLGVLFGLFDYHWLVAAILGLQ